jgi:hypothetical protein
MRNEKEEERKRRGKEDEEWRKGKRRIYLRHLTYHNWLHIDSYTTTPLSHMYYDYFLQAMSV